jgi:uncharacterized protein (DUF1330 family)
MSDTKKAELGSQGLAVPESGLGIYIVGAVEIHDHVGYGKYAELAGKAMQEFKDAGFELEALSVDGHPKIYEGIQPADHLMLFKFKSREDYEAFVASETYQEALPLRLASSTTRFMMAMDSL